jgi:hypothetical protein
VLPGPGRSEKSRAMRRTENPHPRLCRRLHENAGWNVLQ